MAVGVGFGDEGMRHRRRREEKHRPGFEVLLVVQVDPHRAGLDVMHLEKPVMAMHRHVAAKKSRQVAEPVVVHLGIAVTLVVDLPDVDVGDRLTIAHHCILFVVLTALKYCHA